MTSLLGSPFGQSLLSLVLRHAAVVVSGLDSTLHFLNDVQVILDILETAVIGQIVEQCSDFLFGRTHGDSPVG